MVRRGESQGAFGEMSDLLRGGRRFGEPIEFISSSGVRRGDNEVRSGIGSVCASFCRRGRMTSASMSSIDLHLSAYRVEGPSRDSSEKDDRDISWDSQSLDWGKC